ncbi:YeeE/YedE family protein [Membranicola marinus]|uniref:YeeE/YedE family protein n=1 Tax=Membranihabitans marinus TaxID=1227546 RepID=A0A953HP88_9BACT|nr:YeeE/YedE thiosulfate transporter family protein [Membranihabitans marinus]MBY5959242.1 YeeE/YedE family protein [Membranihabitans marinus]
MNEFIEFLSQPWPWYIAGPLLALVMLLLIYFGNTFGVSSNFRTMCSIGGAGKKIPFFDFNWKSQVWNLVFILGAFLGGLVTTMFLMPDTAVGISETTKSELISYGIQNPGEQMLPSQIFNLESLFTVQGLIMIIGGGFLVGFGTRYAGGCTSGHAITGLSNLQLPSLIAVIGFFIGGLLITNLVMPYLLAV